MISEISEKIDTILKQFKHHEKDDGSTECQIIRLHFRIKELNEHLQKHKKDYTVQRTIVKLVARLNTFKKYLWKHKATQYPVLIQALGMRK